MATKRTDSQQEVLQVSGGLAFDAVLNIGAVELPVGVEHCRGGDISLGQPPPSGMLLSTQHSVFTWRRRRLS